MPKIIIASGPVIVEDGKVLLEKSGEDEFWKFIGGRAGENENLIEAAKNRSRLAMGVEIEITEPEPFLMYIKKPGDDEVDVLLVHWLAKRVGEIRPGEETRDWAWHELDKLPDDLAPNILPALKHFDIK